MRTAANLRKSVKVAMVSMALSQAAYAEIVPTEQAQKNGVRTCLGVVDKLANFIIGNHKHASIASWNNKSADTRLFSSQISLRYSDGNAVALMTVAPTKAGQCDAAYTSIWSVDQSCPVVRETTLKDSKYAGELAGLVALEAGNVTQLLLPTPNGTGCTIVKTEVVYEEAEVHSQ
ncbi:MAG: hypothetical protein ACRETN_00785 [Nevskiales bacterium]